MKIFVGNTVKWYSATLKKERTGKVLSIKEGKIIVKVLKENVLVYFNSADNLVKIK